MKKHLLLMLALLPLTALADNGAIYKSEKNGKIEYTSHPEAGGKPAALPKLGHWKIEAPPTEGRVTCDKHGGIDCKKGADGDGSVICLDGFTDSVLRYNFECTAAKLEVSQISDASKEGSFTVTVRNTKSVAAKSVSVIFRPNPMKDGIRLTGPSDIDAYGIGEFSYRTDLTDAFPAKPKVSQISLSCENCG